ncbi:glycosyltransferase [Streptomyces sp. NPDC049597]|uniref:glycosyltransferase n=1 Tax=Streptomyces sp. NPDC049597 TaxID=3155276 RepID=UPI003449AA1D
MTAGLQSAGSVAVDPAQRPVTVVTFSGSRQADVQDSADFRTWAALASRLGAAECIWAGPELECRRGALHVLRRPRRPGILRSLVWAAGAARHGVRVARAALGRGDTVVINGGEPWGWPSAWIVARATRCPLLIDVHGDLLALPVAVFGRWRQIVLRRAAVAFTRHADGCRVVARSMQDGLARRGIPSVLVPPRLLPVWEQPLRRDRPPLADPEVPRLLTVGRLHPSKGLDLLLPAMAELVRTLPSARLRIVGDGPLRAQLNAQAAQLGLTGHVDFLGARGVDDIRAELARADLFVISSRDEGLPRTLLEATAAAVPVVATTVGGIPAAAACWESVTLVAPDAASIADGVRRVLASPPSDEQLAAVRGDVLAQYGFDVNIDAVAALIRSVAAT